MVSTPLVIVKAMSHALSLLDDRRSDIAMWTSPQYIPMFTRDLNYIFNCVYILWCLRHSWSSKLCLTYCRYLTTVVLTSPCENHVAMCKSPQYNPMFTRGLNYIFDSLYILCCLRHSWSSKLCLTHCRYLTTVDPTSPCELRCNITPCLPGV